MKTQENRLMKYLATIDLIAYPPEIIALAFCLGADDPHEVIGIPIEEAGLDEDDFYRLVCTIYREKLITEYLKYWIAGSNLDLCHLDKYDISGEKIKQQEVSNLSYIQLIGLWND